MIPTSKSLSGGFILIFLVTILNQSILYAQHSVAREMNEIVLTAIRNDLARPTVHARNLFHTSVAMYDAWAVFDERAETYLLGKTVNGFSNTLESFPIPTDIGLARQEALAYAVYRIINHRYQNSPDWLSTLTELDIYFSSLGYDPSIVSTDYEDGDPARLGNHIAEVVINYGLQDGSNEIGFYDNLYYESVNDLLIMSKSGNPDISDPNRWQALALTTFIDQSGNEIPLGATEFLSPEWGSVSPFSMSMDVLSIFSRDNNDYWVYHDPGSPPQIDTLNGGLGTDAYQWGFALVSAWASHLSPNDGVMWDISPSAFGNVDIDDYPNTLEEYQNFYNLNEGGDIGTGHAVNPATGMPYSSNIVPRGDYTRVLAEFWADGPDSETPPGHWFTILNYVNDQEQFLKRYRGEGDALDALEWDVKAYFILGGAMHDCAIAAWGIKGWYDYIRPVSALRYMAEKGQSTFPDSANYHVAGLPLIEGFIEQIKDINDPLAGTGNENLGAIKIKSWRGPDFIIDPESDQAGVAWILAKDWWPYQRPSFVTPPFAGYVSGHSTYSRAAAEVLTMITGDSYFPGGIGEFVAKQNEFLVFEEGPSVDITLQWATYRDASDQTSLSRIWGGIHPPADDIPGRLIGEQIGKDAVEFAETYFNLSTSTSLRPDSAIPSIRVWKNPIAFNESIQLISEEPRFIQSIEMFSIEGKMIAQFPIGARSTNFSLHTDIEYSGLYFLRINGRDWTQSEKVIIKQ
ncbi:MAG: T9SS type A sorting domain-containing protein [Bacteroidia bacterium]|nr:T9SS type A sorting domain-containing protein [Bacteroidia bacterium]